MSWDSYIDNLVGHSKDASGTTHCSKACIIGLDGGAKWTTDAHAYALQITPEEAATVARVFKSKDFTTFMTSGITVAGTKFQFLREEDGKVALAKRKEQGAITAQASKTAIVIGFTPEGNQQGTTNKAVAVIAEYLESLNM